MFTFTFSFNFCLGLLPISGAVFCLISSRFFKIDL